MFRVSCQVHHEKSGRRRKEGGSIDQGFTVHPRVRGEHVMFNIENGIQRLIHRAHGDNSGLRRWANQLEADRFSAYESLTPRRAISRNCCAYSFITAPPCTS